MEGYGRILGTQMGLEDVEPFFGADKVRDEAQMITGEVLWRKMRTLRVSGL